MPLRDQVSDHFEEYKAKWDGYDTWSDKDGVAFNIIRHHLEDDYLPTIEKVATSRSIKPTQPASSLSSLRSFKVFKI